MKIIDQSVDNILLHTNIPVDNQQFYLQETYSFNDHKDNEFENNSLNNINIFNDNITVSNLQKIDFSNFFYRQPTQLALGREKGDVSLSSEIDDQSF